MDEIVCGRSAFRYWRCPPQVRELYPPLPWNEQGWHELKCAPFAEDILGLPLDVLRQKGGPHLSSQLRRSSFWSGGLDPGMTVATDMGFSVTSPLVTLFTLARTLEFWDLVMAMYELCGTFSVFEVPAPIREEMTRRLTDERDDNTGNLGRRFDEDDFDSEHWACVFAKKGSRAGRPTSLWRRPPLVEIDALRRFAKQMEQARWGRKFSDAARLVFGIAASPLEVQGTLLLGAPRWRGGSGLDGLSLNEWTPLSAAARKLCSKRTCYGDIVIANPDTLQAVIVECQGEMMHGSGSIQTSDSERAVALQSMGYAVILVSHDMLHDPAQFEIIEQMVYDALGFKWLCKTERERAAASELRRAIFCNWANLA